MNTRTILKGLLGISLAGTFPAVALAQSTVTWQGPVTISGPSDVLTTGSLFGTWAPFAGDAVNGLTVNGVTFQAFATLPNAATTLDNGTGSGSFAPPSTSLDANYNDLMTAGAFGNNNTPYNISWNGMTAGNTYAVQIWVNDGRNSTVNQRTETITGGLGTSASIAYGSGNNGAGQYIIGMFVADVSGAETLTLTPGSAFPSPQFNLIQVRDLTPVPEPSAMAMSLIGFGALMGVLRKKK